MSHNNKKQSQNGQENNQTKQGFGNESDSMRKTAQPSKNDGQGRRYDENERYSANDSGHAKNDKQASPKGNEQARDWSAEKSSKETRTERDQSYNNKKGGMKS